METRDDERREKRAEEADGAAAPHLPNEDDAAAEPAPSQERREIEEMGGEAPCQLHRWMDVDG